MARTLGTLKTIINSRLQQPDGEISSSDLDNLINLSKDKFLLECSPPETHKTSALTPFFESIYDYSVPSDMRPSDGIIGFYPYLPGDKVVDTTVSRVTNMNFVQNVLWARQKGTFTIDENQGTRLLRANPHLDTTAKENLFHDCDSLTSNGTWAASNDANSLAADTGIYTQGSGSLSFDITDSAGTATLTNSTISSVDISGFTKGSTYVFLDVYLPSATNFTNMNFRWGSSSGDYYDQTVTTAFDGSSFAVGWNTLGFAWQGAGVSGTIDNSAIDYLQFNMNYTAAALGNQTGVKIDNIRISQGSLYYIKYFTKSVVQASDLSYKEDFSSDDDVTIFTADTESVFIDYVASQVALDVMSPVGARLQQEAMTSMQRYKLRYPSLRKPTTTVWYRPTQSL